MNYNEIIETLTPDERVALALELVEQIVVHDNNMTALSFEGNKAGYTLKIDAYYTREEE